MMPRRRSDSWSRPRAYSLANERARSTAHDQPVQAVRGLERLGQIDLGDARAQRLRQLGEGGLQVVLGLVPDRALDQGEIGRERPVLARHLEQARGCLEPGVQVAGIEADQRLGDQREVLERAREHADVVERR